MNISKVSRLISVHGIVQGVGFRPFIYRLAHKWGLDGTVANNGDGVRILINGPLAAVDRFVEAVRTDAPPVARIQRLEVRPADQTVPAPGFHIVASETGVQPSTQIAPDIALCADCQADILDPQNRRFGYPFTNCTNCGPRFTIVERIPYDRPNTSMRCFAMCEPCSREYHDPLDRRFHAQPNACPNCGPQLSWHDSAGNPVAGDCLALAATALAAGKVVAIKGLGGFHLAVDAGSEAAVATLRRRKHRPAKPLAVMVQNLAAAQQFCHVSDAEATVLTAPEHPIVLLERKVSAGLAENIAPGLGVMGVMLPYTPLHLLLLHQPQAPAALVMTSGNQSEEPICTGNEEAVARLQGLADFFLLHDREIVTRVDDSVVRIMAGETRVLRRARGYSPVPVILHRPTSALLACGAEMKSSFCIVRNQEAYLSQHIGELTSPACLDFYQESIDHLQAVLATAPARTACDLHPDYQSTRWAESRPFPCVKVQHHHAHTGAVMAEHGLDGPVLSLVLDGAGYGTDGTVFGGEIYRADRSGFERLGHLSHLLLPGGDKAAREPWRMALSLLHQSTGTACLADVDKAGLLQSIPHSSREFICQMMDKGINTPQTSSCGRLFDAVSALLGLCLISDYEGQAAMLLEHQATLAGKTGDVTGYPACIVEEEGLLIVNAAALGPLMLDDLAHKIPIPVIARRFHLWLADALTHVLEILRSRSSLNDVVLTGGCMQNKLLFETLVQRLQDRRFHVLAGALVPMNDGGIALGQAFIGGNPCV